METTQWNPTDRDQFDDQTALKIKAEIKTEYSKILTRPALRFLAMLQTQFGARREQLLNRRKEVQLRIDSGEMPNFLAETQEIRESEWRVAPIPAELMDRRVEITGPVDRKMVINALNSGAQVYMADFEDSHAPTWSGTLEGQVNLFDAIRRTIQFESPDGKTYSLTDQTAVLLVRPRGWHLEEKHVSLGGRAMSASLFDFGLYFFHNAQELVRKGSRPSFYLPKMESHLEARLWNDVFKFSQRELGIPQGTIRATVLIETLPAAFEMDEILYELRDHHAGLNCGRWDYIFSFIKKFRNQAEFVLPDRAQVTMNVHFLQSYCKLLIQTCHRRGIHAMGGMAAQIPIKNHPVENSQAMEKVIADKKREVELGHDGTWVAHPGLVSLARQVFDEKMPTPNQISLTRQEWNIAAKDLLTVPSGEVTQNGIRTNINVALLYLESWLRGIGCVPLYHLMEDAATAEISRAQIWQWIKHQRMSVSDFRKILAEEMDQIRNSIGEEKFQFGKYQLASEILTHIITQREFVEFLTLPAYTYL
jgi:malate synthase